MIMSRANSHPSPRPRIHDQDGTAVVTALLVVVIAASVASLLLVTQAHSLSRVERTIERAQIAAFATTTIDWSRAILRDHAKSGKPYTTLRDQWAQGLQSTPAEGVIASGVINDAQARFNLNHLVDDQGKASEPDIVLFRRLLSELKLDPGLADAVVDFIDSDDDIRGSGGAETGYYSALSTPYRAANRRLASVDELARVRGFDGGVLRRLSPFVVALPASASNRAKINLNTAPREVLAALFAPAGPAVVDGIISTRELPLPFVSTGEFQTQFPSVNGQDVERFATVTSRHFLVTTALVGNGAALRQTALVQIDAQQAATTWPAIIWVKET